MDKSKPIIVVNVDEYSNNTLSEITSVEDTINLYNCISDEFPIIDITINKGIATCKIGNPRNGYTIVTSTKGDKLNGEATIFTPDNIRIATFTYEEDEATGKCIFYYRSGKPLFQGYLKNGYRDGFGVEYNKEGRIASRGFFKDGHNNPLITRSAEDSNLWYERDQFGNLISICHKDENGLNHGNCFFYNHGKLSYISVWEHDKEIETTHTFNENTLTTYKDGKIVYQGNYVMKSEFEFIPKERIQIDNYDSSSSRYQRNMTVNNRTNNNDYSYCCTTAAITFCLFFVESALMPIFDTMESEASYYFALLSLVTFLIFLISCCCCISKSNV